MFIWLLATALLTTALPAGAQQTANIPRIGYLSALDSAREFTRSEAIRLALRELGYIEAHNIDVEYRYADGKNDRLPALAADLARLKVDIIVAAGGDPGIQAAKGATSTIPIVMVNSPNDPVEAGLVDSLARPGGNVTGLTLLTRELSGKRLELLKEAVPKVARVAVLYDPRIPRILTQLQDVLPAAARALGFTFQLREIRAQDDFERLFTKLNKDRPDALYLPHAGPLMAANRKRLAGFASKSRLPSMYVTKEFVDAGGLMSYGADLADSYRRVAYLIDRILRGAKPGDLPVEQPTKFELVINLKTAKPIGLIIPPNVLARADRVIR
jgi:putative ABC transport system substrate-binding protein